jgi:hypothetical protein
MDPQANLEEQKRIRKYIQEQFRERRKTGIYIALDDSFNRLIDLEKALEEWEARGGFSPYSK